MPTNEVKKVISNMANLPTMPQVVGQALNIIDNPKSNINQLADVISKDQAITTQILKLVNSAYYGFPQQITTINKAMALLGFDKVKSLIMSVAVKPMMMSSSGKTLWDHSIRCAVAAQIISADIGYSDTDEAFVMGLLHDIGKTIMEMVNKDAMKEIKRLTSIGADILKAEETFYGFNHTQAGQELVTRWKLPMVIGTAIKYHHTPNRAQDKLGSGIVYVADRITQEQLKYPILESEVIEQLDFEIPDPTELRENVFMASQYIIDALS